MTTSIWMVFGGVALGVFWAVGAYNRLSGLRDRVVQRQAEADRVLRARRKAVLAWVAVAENADATVGDTASMGLAPLEPGSAATFRAAPVLASTASGLEGGSLALNAARSPQATEGPDPHTVEMVMHACAQAAAAGERARDQPTRRGAMASLNMAEQVLERTLREFMQQPAAVATAQTLRRRASWMACEVQLTVARQVLNRDIAAYNAAVKQFPARLLATLVGLRPTEPLRAGAELSPTVAPARAAADTAGAPAAPPQALAP